MQGVPPVVPGQQPHLPVTASLSIPLVLGEIVRGEVVNILPDAVSMRIKKEIVLSKTDVPLRKGEAYLLRVESVGENHVTLKVLQALTGETDQAQKILQSALSRMEKVTSDQLAAARAVLQEIPDAVRNELPAWGALAKLLNNASDLTEGLLKTAMDSTGIFFETKLKEWVLKQMDSESFLDEGGEIARIIREDLKGNLLKLKQQIHDPLALNRFKENNVSIEPIETAVEKFLTHIEQHQMESKLNGVLQTFLPFVWKGLEDGKMLFKESYHPREGGQPEYACVIHLDLENVGKLVAVVRTFSERLYLRFVTENAEFKQLIEANTPFLKKQLADVGIVCDTVRVEQEEKIDFGVLTGEPELDIRI